jgi:hypothetical protein
MKLDSIREAWGYSPFRPFRIQLDNGGSIPIRHPDYLFFPPNRPDIIVCVHPNGGVQVLDTVHIVALQNAAGEAA